MGAECVSLNVPFQWEHLNLFGLHVKPVELLIKKKKSEGKWKIMKILMLKRVDILRNV